VEQIMVMNLLGGVVLDINPGESGVVEINLTGHPAGIYLIRITRESGDMQVVRVRKKD
jgi:hypothetical protein